MRDTKWLTLALLLSAIPAIAQGQPEIVVACEDPCYVAPFVKGQGGFVAQGRTGTEVVFAVSCGSTVQTAAAKQDSEGIVRQLLTWENGLACDADGGGELQIDKIQPGGWYWIHDERNAAVSPLVRAASLAGPPTIPFDPGGVTMTTRDGGAGTFVKHEPSGRVGILHHVLPAPVPPLCGGESNLSDQCLLAPRFGLEITWQATGGDAPSAPVGSSLTRLEDGDITLSVKITGEGFVLADTEMPLLAGTLIKHLKTAPPAVLIDLPLLGIVLPDGAPCDRPGGPPTGCSLMMAPPGEISRYVIQDATEADERCHESNPDRANPLDLQIGVGAVLNVVPALSTDDVLAMQLFHVFSLACPPLPAAP
jgi:hypothetical protein